MTRGILAALILAVPAVADARSSTTMTLMCQKNLGDGRILVSNGDRLPPNSTFKVIKYRPTSRDGIWSTGPCTVLVTTR